MDDDLEPEMWCRVQNRHCDDELCADYGCALEAGLVPDRRGDHEPDEWPATHTKEG